MAYFRMGLESIGEGVALTVANSDDGLDTGVTAVTFAAFIAKAAAAAFGDRGLEITPAANVVEEFNWSFPATDRVHISAHYRRMGPVSVTHAIAQLRNTGGVGICDLACHSSASGRLVPRASGGSGWYNNALANAPEGTYRRVEVDYTRGTTTSNGRGEFAVYDMGGTELAHPAPVTNLNLGILDFSAFRLGRPSAATADTTTEQWDGIQVWTGADVPATMDNPWPNDPISGIRTLQSGIWVEAGRRVWNGTDWVL